MFKNIFIDRIKQIVDNNVIHLSIACKVIKRACDRVNGRNTSYIVSVFLNDISISVGQVKVNDKLNEITAVSGLIKLLDIKGKIITKH